MPGDFASGCGVGDECDRAGKSRQGDVDGKKNGHAGAGHPLSALRRWRIDTGSGCVLLLSSGERVASELNDLAIAEWVCRGR